MNNFLKKILILFMMVFSSSIYGKLPPSISTGGNALNIIFAVDTSGSMSASGQPSYPIYSVTGYVSGNTLYLSSRTNCSTISNKTSYYIYDPTYTTNTFPRGGGVTVLNYIPISASSCKATLSASKNITTRNFSLSLSETSPTPRYISVQNAISQIISDKSLASQANFALLTWSSNTATQKGSCKSYPTQTYTWVPLNTSKTQNLIDIQQGVTCINATGSTYVNYPMSFLQNYINSSSFSPFDSCATTLIIVMSDGIWSGGSTAEAIASNLLKRSRPIKTYAVAMDISPTATNFTALAQAGGTLSTPGVLGGFNTSATTLVNAFKAAIQTSLFDSYSAVAPTIMQKTPTNALILVPDFQYKATIQWPGHLTASTINADGSISPTSSWEFGEKLDKLSPNSRYIWTAAPGLPVNTSSTPNNFTTSNLTNIASAMGDDINTTTQLIYFIRGYDAFDENNNNSTTDIRWKLNDIYNSKPIYVAQPEQTITSDSNFIGGKKYFYNLNPSAYSTFLNNTKNRKSMVYVGSNGGVLHAIDADTGDETWAFVPPPLLDKLDNMVNTALLHSTNSIYGVDGSPVAQDVYIDGTWKTYLAVTLGMGARGFSVLDITNPNIPLHLFSIERYSDINGNEHTRLWRSNGTLFTESNMPGLDNIYTALGYTTSTPVFSYAKSHNGAYSPVLILGEGTSNNGLTNVKIYLGNNATQTSVGAGTYIIGLNKGDQEGMLLHSKDVGYTSTSNTPIPSAAILTISTTTSTSNSYSVQITNTYDLDEGTTVSGNGIPLGTYVTSIDSSTQVTFNNPVSLSAGTSLTFTRKIFNEVMAQISIMESGSTPYMSGKYGYRMLSPNNNGFIHSFSDIGSDASTIDYPYSSFSSTAPRGAYGAFNVINSGTTFANDRLIQQPLSISKCLANPINELNVVYGTGDMEILSMTNKSPDNLLVSIQDTENNIFGLNKSRSFLTSDSSSWGSSSLFFNATNTSSPSCQSNSQLGWYVRMNGLSAFDENNNLKTFNLAKLAAKPETVGGLVAAPIYIPPIDLNSCSLGSSALIYRDCKCGYSSGPALYLTNMLIGGVATFKNNIYISVSSKSNVTKVDAAGKYTKTGSVITGQPGFTFKPATLKGKLRVR